MVPSRGQQQCHTAPPEFFAAHAVRALSGLSLEGKRDILREIRKGNREGKQEGTQCKVCNGNSEVQGKVGLSMRVVRA